MAQTAPLPVWTLGDRLRKSREHADLSSQQMAALLRVSRNTVSNYENGRSTPSWAVLMAWSSLTGVPVEWLADTEEGEVGPLSRWITDHAGQDARELVAA